MPGPPPKVSYTMAALMRYWRRELYTSATEATMAVQSSESHDRLRRTRALSPRQIPTFGLAKKRTHGQLEGGWASG